MLHRVALVRTDVSEERIASIIRVERIGELRTTLAVTSNRRSVRRVLVTANVPSSPIFVTLMMDALRFSETSVLTRATRLRSQKTPFFIVTAEKTSNLTSSPLLFKTQISLTGLCLCFEVEPTHMGPNRQSYSLFPIFYLNPYFEDGILPPVFRLNLHSGAKRQNSSLSPVFYSKPHFGDRILCPSSCAT
jgi:hypothetical protein